MQATMRRKKNKPFRILPQMIEWTKKAWILSKTWYANAKLDSKKKSSSFWSRKKKKKKWRQKKSFKSKRKFRITIPAWKTQVR